MARVDEFYRDNDAPAPLGLVLVAYAVVRDERGEVVLVQRRDDHNWELPGGRVEVGETVGEAVVREVAEEAGIAITLTGIAGVYSDPTHIVVYPVDGARQQIAVVFHARPADPDDHTLAPDHDETGRAAWFDPTTTGAIRMHAAVRLRLDDAITHPDHPAIA